MNEIRMAKSAHLIAKKHFQGLEHFLHNHFCIAEQSFKQEGHRGWGQGERAPKNSGGSCTEGWTIVGGKRTSQVGGNREKLRKNSQ